MIALRALAALLGLLLMASHAGAVEVKEVTTPLGIKAWLVEDRSTPVVSLSFSFAGGSAQDGEARKGLTSLTASLLTDGAGALDARAFKLRLEEASVSLSFSATPDYVGGSMRLLSANRDDGFELLKLAVAAPRFDSDRFEQRRAQTIARLNQLDQRPATVVQRTMMATVFAGHPYADNSSGVRANLLKLTVEDVKQRARSLLVRGGLLIAAVGDIDAAELARQLDRAFGDLPAGPVAAPLPDWMPTVRPSTVTVERSVPQSSIAIAFPGLLRQDPDWYAGMVIAHVLGGGQQSRLFAEVREKRGLAYSISAGLRSQQKASLLVVSTATANERVTEAIQVVRSELHRFRDDGVTEQELSDAKAYLIGALPVSLDSSASIAALLHSMQVDRLPRDYIDTRPGLIGAVKLDDVRRVARRLLRDEAATMVVVGKPVRLTEP
jgi:zinc protease